MNVYMNYKKNVLSSIYNYTGSLESIVRNVVFDTQINETA
jgi:hypothetical protein